MIASLAALVLAAQAPSPQAPQAPQAELTAGLWQAEVTGPGGPVHFGLELQADDAGAWTGWIHNAEEKLPIGKATLRGTELRLELWPYESVITASVEKGGKAMRGTWTRSRGRAEPTSMPFSARTPVPSGPMDGNVAVTLAERYRVQFSSSEEPSVMLLKQSGNELSGTILTTVGDYRFLEGTVRGGQMRLSVFDGAHAFLFRAERQADGSLKGDFWSRDSWHETFTAVPDDTIEMPDPYGLSKWTGDVPLGKLVFPGLDGKPKRLDDPAFDGKARLVVLFGTWCPNCYDETRYLNELVERYGARGLSVLGLAFEFEDEFERQAAGVRRYIDRMDVKYPILIAGPTDKAKASAAFPALDRVRAYPTTLFMNAKGEVEAVHTGFNGPATGPRHTRLREEFETTIERLLGA